MIQITNYETYNFHNALRGARNPMNSWDRMDSGFNEKGEYIYGEKDLKLLKNLCISGSEHRKFMRQIFVSVDICAPLYWWKEFDTYKVGTTAFSTSTMHKIHSKEITLNDFSHDHLDEESNSILSDFIRKIENIRLRYIESKNKDEWYKIIQLLPASYNQLRTCTMSYENLFNMYHQRKDHKLDEWREYCNWIKTLQYAKDLICID